MIRICILTANNEPAAFMDNDAPEALHYYNDTLHTFLAGSAYTLEFTADASHPDVEFLAVGNKLAFVDNEQKYYLNITQAEQDEEEIMVTAMGLSFELINENAPAYAATSAMTFAQYMTAMGYNSSVIQIGINEVSDLSRTNEWESDTETRLARLFSLASLFDAELEFVPQLNKDYSLNKIILNIYRAHSDLYQGMGRFREDIRLRYGRDVSSIRRKSDISNLYTAIYATGKDGLDLTSKSETITDDDGNVLYETTLGEAAIRAVRARDQFPSNTSVTADRYITYYWATDYETVNALYGNALAKLKEISKPAVEYEINGYADLNIGDTVIVTDEAFNPALYLEVRVTEQERSFTEPGRCTTKFDNVTELTSQISSDLLAQIEDLQTRVASAQQTATSAASTASEASSTASSAASTASAASAAVATQAEHFFFDSAGSHVTSEANDATTGSNVLIGEDSVDIMDGTDVLARFGANLVELGKNGATTIIDLINGLGQIKATRQLWETVTWTILEIISTTFLRLATKVDDVDRAYIQLYRNAIEMYADKMSLHSIGLSDVSLLLSSSYGDIQLESYRAGIKLYAGTHLQANESVIDVQGGDFTFNNNRVLTENDIKLVDEYISSAAKSCAAGAATDLHTYTVTEAGLYQVSICGQISGNSGTGRYDFYVNSSNHTDPFTEVTFPTAQTYPCVSATGVVNCAVGDVIRWYTWCSAAYTLNYQAMQIVKLRGA